MVQWLPVSQLADEVRRGKRTARENVERSLRIIEDKADYRAIIAVTRERALQRAAEIDRQVKDGTMRGRLAGVPFIPKDNFLAFGAETTAASNILKGFNAPYQATAIERLEAEGAICVAKANLDAFAHGSSTEHSDFMVTRNPHDTSRVPGGSSGGSSAAVVLGMAPFALGTDTGGSIRLPAAFSGAVGYKPTYGLVSRSGVIAMASSTDVIGPLTTNVADAAFVLDILAGKDPLDSTTIDRDHKSYMQWDVKVKGAKVGVVKEFMDEGIYGGVKNQVESAIRKLEAAGAKVESFSLPSVKLALACYYIIMPAEVSSNLSRYDGQHYGYSSPKARDLLESYNWSRSEGFGREAKRRIMIGTYVLSSGYYEAYYRRAQLVRTKLIREFAAAFSRFDFLVGPTAPTTAFKIGEKTSDPLQMYLTDVLTVSANLVGNPAVSLPAGLSGGLPVGLQIMAAQRHDRQLLGFANETERILA